MRPESRWQLEPTLRFLALVPLAMAGTGLLFEIASRLAGLTPHADSPRPAWLLAVGTALLHLVVLAAIHLLLLQQQLTWRRAFGLFQPAWPARWLRTAAWTLPALLAAWLLHHTASWLLDLARIPHDSQAAVEALRLASAPWERLALAALAVLSAPWVEELLFRGILWPVVRDLGWPRVGAVGVSLLFALIHFNAAALLPLWALGLFWIWLYESTGDLTAPVLSHALFNGINFAWLLLLDSPPSP